MFQDTVDVDALVDMGDEGNPSAVPALAGLTRDTGIGLLDRAAEIGLLTALGGGYYAIHPALPWFFRRLHASTTAGDPDKTARVWAAYASVVAALGTTYHRWYIEGRTEVVAVLRLEEANLLHARSLARAAGRWSDVIGCMQGLRHLYRHIGRGAEWARLVDELVPDLVAPDTGGPQPGLDDQWSLLTEYRVDIAQTSRDWTEALRLQQANVDHARREAAAALDTAPNRRTAEDRNRIRTLSVAEERLGNILREQRDPDCVTHYERAAGLLDSIDDRHEAGVVAFNLGHTYLDIPSLRNLDLAEHWYHRALDLTDEQDRIRRARRIGQLGRVLYERFRDGRTSGQPEPVLLEHLNAAAAAYQQALDLLPADAAPDLATAHHQLGAIYTVADQPDTASTHFQQAIRLWEATGNRYYAGQARHAVAIMFARAGRTSEALLYARAALADFTPYGAGAAADIEQVQQLIALLDPAADPTTNGAS